jgi:hypothetical protein
MSDKEDLKKFVDAVIKHEDVRKDLENGDYAEAFKHAGLSAPTQAQVQALTNLKSDWSLLQALAESFWNPINMN